MINLLSVCIAYPTSGLPTVFHVVLALYVKKRISRGLKPGLRLPTAGDLQKENSALDGREAQRVWAVLQKAEERQLGPREGE